MTLIPCNAQSEKLFRPWDSDCGASARTTSSSNSKESSPAAAIILAMKEEQHDRLLVVSSPESSPSGAHSSSSGASSCDESEASSSSSNSSSLGAGSPAASAYSYSAIQQAYSAHMMSLGHQHQPSPFLASGWMPSADTFHPHLHHHHHHHQLPQHFQPEAPSMERFLASLESSPEALHPSRLAALGMGPNEIGELYQMAGFKPLIQHHYPSAAMAGTTSSSHHHHHHHHNPSSGSGNKKQRPKRFRCPHCQVAFSNNGQLKGHVRSHTGTFNSFIFNNYQLL